MMQTDLAQVLPCCCHLKVASAFSLQDWFLMPEPLHDRKVQLVLKTSRLAESLQHPTSGQWS